MRLKSGKEQDLPKLFEQLRRIVNRMARPLPQPGFSR